MSVVAGITPSPIADTVLANAIEEAQRRSTSLVLVSHVGSPRSREDALSHTDERKQRLAWLEERAATARSGGIADVELLLPSTPATLSEAILEADQREDVDVIVIGIPRRSRVGKAIIGSSSQDILLGADHPVLGIKLPPGQE